MRKQVDEEAKAKRRAEIGRAIVRHQKIMEKRGDDGTVMQLAAGHAILRQMKK